MPIVVSTADVVSELGSVKVKEIPALLNITAYGRTWTLFCENWVFLWEAALLYPD